MNAWETNCLITEKKDQAQIWISLSIINKSEAESTPVGEGQEEPNINPFLEKPTKGRKIGDAIVSQINFLKNLKFFGIFRFLKYLGIGIAIFLLIFILFISPGILIKK